MDQNVTEKFIEAVKTEILQNMSECKSNKVTCNNWDLIGSTLGLSGEAVKKKWKGLRDSYTKHLRSLKTTNGQEAKQLNRYRAWPWANKMSFLKPYIEISIDSNISSQIPKQGVSHCKRHKCKRHTLGARPGQSKVRLAPVVRKKRVPQDRDDIDLMFLSFAKTVKQFSPLRKAEIKAKLAQYISELELVHLHEKEMHAQQRELLLSTSTFLKQELQ